MQILGRCSILLAVLSFGCGTHSALVRTASSADLTADEADKIVEAYRNRHETRAANPNPLKDPKSLDDVLAVLKLDEIALFPGSTKFALAEGSPRGKALAAQIMIAWGDDQHLMAALLSRATRDLDTYRAKLEERQAAGKLGADDQARLSRLEKTIDDVNGVEHALRHVGNQHIADGIRVAEQVIAAAPNEYEGYRVAADYYQVRAEWPKFDEMVKKIEELNPQSVGLLFLRAEAARDRDHNRLEAARLFREALAREPKFARAQVAVLVLQPDLNGAHAEMKKLEQINPQHQVVVWMGPLLERDYQDLKEMNQRIETRITDQALPGAAE